MESISSRTIDLPGDQCGEPGDDSHHSDHTLQEMGHHPASTRAHLPDPPSWPRPRSSPQLLQRRSSRSLRNRKTTRSLRLRRKQHRHLHRNRRTMTMATATTTTTTTTTMTTAPPSPHFSSLTAAPASILDGGDRRQLQREPGKPRAAANVEARIPAYRQVAAGGL
jgi:hypothetical protein